MFLVPKSPGEAAAGFVTQTPAAAAARLLYAKSHRIATDAEVEAHRAREQRMESAARQERLRRQGTSQVVVEASPPARRGRG